MSRSHPARQEARARGFKRFDGNACSHCGTTERYTDNGACCECNRRKCMEWYREKRKRPAARHLPAALPVAHSDFIRRITRAQLMAGR